MGMRRAAARLLLTWILVLSASLRGATPASVGQHIRKRRLDLNLRQIDLMNILHVRHRFHRVSAASRLSKALATAVGPAD